MRILLTNDDGIHAHGLKVLEKIARSFTDDVWIVAPELDQSGSSHSLTLREPLRIRDISEKKYALNGTPTDCVMAGIGYICKDKTPDLILSGVNFGANIADDVTYSGTIAGAIEGMLLNVPSVALSLMTDYKPHNTKWSTAEYHGVKVLEKILQCGIPPKVIINVNFPDAISSSVKGIKITRQGHRNNVARFIEREDPRGKKYFWIGLGSETYETVNHPVGTDIDAVLNGYISVTPLSLDLTHMPTAESLKGAFVA